MELERQGKPNSFNIEGIDARLFSIHYAPRDAPLPYEKPACTRFERCKGCPYPSHGFICWREDGECMKTDVEKIAKRERERKNAGNCQ